MKSVVAAHVAFEANGHSRMRLHDAKNLCEKGLRGRQRDSLASDETDHLGEPHPSGARIDHHSRALERAVAADAVVAPSVQFPVRRRSSTLDARKACVGGKGALSAATFVLQ